MTRLAELPGVQGLEHSVRSITNVYAMIEICGETPPPKCLSLIITLFLAGGGF